MFAVARPFQSVAIDRLPGTEDDGDDEEEEKREVEREHPPVVQPRHTERCLSLTAASLLIHALSAASPTFVPG